MRYKKEDSQVNIKCFSNSFLQLIGLKKGKDFRSFNDHLYIVMHPHRRRILTVLKESYPEYNFYWDKGGILRWF